ncbi:MAG: hypothetical protein Q7U13_04390 [Rhodoferax sp.]|nr:hypothetical protein [Rhodoferax sp.]
MKFNKLSALCALACVAMSGQAMAATALSAADKAIVDDANTNSRVVFISGASAVQKGFTGIVAGLFTGTPVRFANTSASSKDFEAVAGKLAVAAGGWAANSNVIVIYRVKGGSVFGVDPVARNTLIESLNVTSGASDCTTGSGTTAAPYVCTTTLASRAPDAGVSDVAPALFDGLYNTEGETAAPALTPAELALLTPTPIYGLAFGVPVTSNVPLVNLNKSVISAIMTGNIGTWDQVDASLPADDILICRRVPGSGTQAVNNMYFGNYPCDTSGAVSNVPADRDASAAWDNASNTYTVGANTGGLVVIENSTSGDVRNCLDKAVTGGTYTTKDRDGVAVTVNMTPGHKAIGVLSMDGLSSSKTTGNWQFRSLDGAGTYTWDNTAVAPVASGTGKFPTLANYVNGTWDQQGWVSFNVPARTTGSKAALLANFVAKAQDPAILASIADLKNVAAAIPGGAYAGAQVLRSAYVNGNQCAPLNRNY